MCQQSEDTWQHVLRCPQIDMSRARQEYITEFSKTLSQLKTYPPMKDHFMKVINAWMKNTPIPSPPISIHPMKFRLKQAHSQQLSLGFDNFMQGFHGVAWANLQQLYYDNTIRDRKFNVFRWENNVVESLWKLNHGMWVERCNLQHAESLATEETRKRKNAWSFCQSNKHKLTHLDPNDRHLVHRKSSFFESADMPSLEMWQNRLILALERAQRNSSCGRKRMANWLGISGQRVQIINRKKNKVKKTKQSTLTAFPLTISNENDKDSSVQTGMVPHDSSRDQQNSREIDIPRAPIPYPNVHHDQSNVLDAAGHVTHLRDNNENQPNVVDDVCPLREPIDTSSSDVYSTVKEYDFQLSKKIRTTPIGNHERKQHRMNPYIRNIQKPYVSTDSHVRNCTKRKTENCNPDLQSQREKIRKTSSEPRVRKNQYIVFPESKIQTNPYSS